MIEYWWSPFEPHYPLSMRQKAPEKWGSSVRCERHRSAAKTDANEGVTENGRCDSGFELSYQEERALRVLIVSILRKRKCAFAVQYY